jgi:diphthamide synthase subunit DPH2
VLGTLGQGNSAIFGRIQKLLDKKGIKYVLVLLSEALLGKLTMLPEKEVPVQVARCATLPSNLMHASPVRFVVLEVSSR